MKHYGLSLAEGSEIVNLTVPTGVSFPANDNVGELFFKTDVNKLYVRNNTVWFEIGGGATFNLVDDLTPQLGGNLDTNTFDIIVASGDKITLNDAPVIGTDASNKAYVDSKTKKTQSYFFSSF